MGEQNKVVSNHCIYIDNRSKLTVSGVCDVDSFDEQTVVLKTVMGELTVKGESLKVNSFAVETGNLTVEGNIIAFAYTSQPQKKNVLNRLFG